MNAKGFTIVEVLIAVLVLTVGILGLASSAALTTRMIGQGYTSSEAATIGAQQLEVLRSQWRDCATMASGYRTQGTYTVTWTVTTPSTTANPARQISVVVEAPRAGLGVRADSFITTIPC